MAIMEEMNLLTHAYSCVSGRPGFCTQTTAKVDVYTSPMAGNAVNREKGGMEGWKELQDELLRWESSSVPGYPVSPCLLHIRLLHISLLLSLLFCHVV